MRIARQLSINNELILVVVMPLLRTFISGVVRALRLPVTRIRLFRTFIPFHVERATVNDRLNDPTRQANGNAIRDRSIRLRAHPNHLALRNQLRECINGAVADAVKRVSQHISTGVCFRFSMFVGFIFCDRGARLVYIYGYILRAIFLYQRSGA